MSIQQSVTGAVSSAENAVASVPVITKTKEVLDKGITVRPDEETKTLLNKHLADIAPSSNSVKGQTMDFKSDIFRKMGVAAAVSHIANNFTDTDWSYKATNIEPPTITEGGKYETKFK